jgi:hypothetical protein
MILHRRIHKFVAGKFDEGVDLAQQLNRLGRDKLGAKSQVYVSSIWGGSQPRPRLFIDTQHMTLAAMEDYFAKFFDLPEVKELMPKWQAVEEESWAENYTLLVD